MRVTEGIGADWLDGTRCIECSKFIWADASGLGAMCRDCEDEIAEIEQEEVENEKD